MRPDGQPVSLKEYEAAGGYQGLRKALREMTLAAVIEEIKQANLLGRGGAGFPTAMKWDVVPKPEEDPGPRYAVVNADEMEPGAFKDRLLLEGDPHEIIEGLIIGAHAIQATNAFIFLRWEYRRAARVLRNAIAEAYAAGYLGDNVLGSGYKLRLHLHASAGRYMCGEGDALLNVLEGRRAIPRTRPPHQTLTGLWGRPTITNNVETFACVPHIIARGAEWFRGLSLTDEGGTKIYGASGRVKRPGLWELPLGTTIREVLEEHAGGMSDGYRLRGLLPGGASTDFLVEEHLDVKLDFKSVAQAGSRLGTGTMVILDDRTCPVGTLLSLQRFFARESCGWCTPCRDSLPWIAQTLAAIEQGRGEPGDLETLERHPQLVRMGHTFCALAPGAMESVGSAVKFFREDFERHIREGRCPYAGARG
jgi:NADH-quinone oxidoreductase subunit F